MGQTCCGGTHGNGLSNEEFIYQMGSVVADPALAGVVAGLTKLAEDHPEFALAKKTQEAESCLERVTDSLEYELAQIRDAFRRFDHDDSKHLDTNEFKLTPGRKRQSAVELGWRGWPVQ
eukprot:g27590.t1